MNLIYKINFGHHLILLGSVMFIFSIIIATPLTTGHSSAFGTTEIIDEINEIRSSKNLRPLTQNNVLQQVSQQKAQDMANERYFDHISPSGKQIWDYLDDINYEYLSAGENLAISNEDASSVIHGWTNSKSHLENILNNEYSQIGIGVAYYDQYGDYEGSYVVVAVFAQPAYSHSAYGQTTSTKSGSGLVDMNSPNIALYAVLLIVMGFGIELMRVRKLHHAGIHIFR